MRRRRLRPQPCVQDKKHTSVVTTVTPDHPGISRGDGVTVSFVLSPEIGLSCLRHSSEALASQELHASVEASGPHDFAVRLRALRQGHFDVHRIPHPTFVTIAKRPFWIGRGTGGKLPVICPSPQAKTLRRIGTTGKSACRASTGVKGCRRSDTQI
jgi:hypothetical protein